MLPTTDVEINIGYEDLEEADKFINSCILSMKSNTPIIRDGLQYLVVGYVWITPREPVALKIYIRRIRK